MKKKFLKSLNALEKWLGEKQAGNQEAHNALNFLRKTITEVPEDETESEASDQLPPPKELSDDPMAIAIFTDGACRGNPGPGAFAYVIQGHDGQVLGQGVEYDSLTTNNKMELSGALHGLQELRAILPLRNMDPRLSRIKVVTDSKYLVDGMKTWVEGWKARGWKKADNKTPENLELWQSLDKERYQFLQVDWVWVKGHAGHPQNEYCDRKANEVMDQHT